MLHNHNTKLNPDAAGIYYLRADNTYYIGMTTRSFKQRWQEHSNDLRNNTHANYKLQSAYASGLDIACGVLIVLQSKELIEKTERILIDYYKDRVSLLNLEGVTMPRKEEIIDTPEREIGNTTISALQSDISGTDISEIGTQNGLYLYDRICEMRNNGKVKSEIIKALWGVSAGGSAKYKAASKLYDAIVTLDK
jgi:hypothetical protein